MIGSFLARISFITGSRCESRKESTFAPCSILCGGAAGKIPFQIVKVRLVWIGERTVVYPRRRIRCRFTWTATTR